MRRLSREARFWVSDKFAVVRFQLRDVGRLQIAAIGTQHRVEAVGGGENDFGDSLAALGYQGGRQQVLKFMRQLAELPKSARCGIALEGVHGATHASQGIGIARINLEKNPRFVQLLQQVLRALKEEFAKFGGAFIGKKVQPATSMR
jgi:hypothetical protein